MIIWKSSFKFKQANPNPMKILNWLILLSLAFTAGAQAVKKDTANSEKVHKDSCHCYLPKGPDQLNPYPFADSVKTKKPAGKTKKKTNLSVLNKVAATAAHNGVKVANTLEYLYPEILQAIQG